MSEKLISCIILAGGEAKRFNSEDKGLVVLNGKPLIAHVIEHIHHQVDDIVISANRNLDTYKQYTSLVVADQHDGFQGPLAGIASALPFCQHQWVLVVPCDIPFLPDDLVKTMNPENTNLLHILKINGRLQLIFLMHKDLVTDLNKYLNNENHKVMDWADKQTPLVIEIESDTDAFSNLNTLDQLKKLSD